jgi:hypothetical protein
VLSRLFHGLIGLAWPVSVLAGRAQTLPAASADALLEGQLLARAHCSTCHLFPPPDAVDLATWRDQILPRMKYRLGFSTAELEKSTNIALLREHRRIPLTPVITEAQWLKLAGYYFAHAPAEPLQLTNRPPITVGLPGFKVRPLPFRLTNAAITAVAVVAEGGALAADATRNLIFRLNRAGQPTTTVELPGGVASWRRYDHRFLVTGIGSFLPTDLRLGSVQWLEAAPGGKLSLRPVLTGLPRTTDALRADFNRDGLADYVVSSFGNNVGQLAWHQGGTNGLGPPSELFNLPGTLRAETRDFNGDGWTDVVALVAQETESLLLFTNDTKGGFGKQVIFQRPPHWGHSHFEIADFNKDGRPDFLVSNGDNGEFSSPPKRVHGVRIFTAQPDLTWTESFFFPQNGTYHAGAADFDGDGDLDIASISYFVDYARAPRESFVLLTNDGQGGFAAATFPESATGRWVAMDVGDFDADGDPDILLGSYINGPTPVPQKVFDTWQQMEQPLLLLENRRISASPKPAAVPAATPPPAP